MIRRASTHHLSILVLAAFIASCGRPEDDAIMGTLERDRLELIAEANEPIVAIEVKEGDLLAAGDTLLELDSTRVRARLDQADAAVNLAEHRLAEIAGPREQEIREARAALQAAVSAARSAASEFARISDLVERRLLSQSELDRARAERDRTAGVSEQARAQLDLLLEGTRREALDQAEAELRAAQAALAELRASAARYTVIAPRAGRIEALPFKLGERPFAGAPVVIMLADGTPYARVYVPEPRRAHFQPGTRVTVSIDGIERSFLGVVRFIASQAQFTPYYALTQEDRSRLSYLAEIDLPEQQAQALPTGIPVQVRRAQR